MTTIENELLSALALLETRAKDPLSKTSKPSLLELFTQIEALQTQGMDTLNPQLRHYLERKSYEKALGWLREKAQS